MTVHALPRIWLRGFSPTRTACDMIRNGKLTSGNPERVTCRNCLRFMIRALNAAGTRSALRLAAAFRDAHGHWRPGKALEPGVVPLAAATDPEATPSHRLIGREKRDRLIRCVRCKAPVWAGQMDEHVCAHGDAWDRKEVA